jgi:glycerophosphoryl diester phosphodiesterase
MDRENNYCIMKKIYFTFLVTCSTLCLSAQQMFVAHRGASYLAPENTVAAANMAWMLDADAVEVDIYLSDDNRVMVIHDKDTKRTCKGNNNFVIKDTPSGFLRNLDVGVWKGEEFKGEKIPFLSEIIETVPEGKMLVVEIKCGSEVLPYLQRCIEKAGKKDQIIFISFGWETIIDTKNLFPENKCYWLSSVKQGLKNKIKKANAIGLDGVNLHYKIINEKVVKLANDHGLDVLAWTVDDPSEAKRLTDIGVKIITTNRPAWLKEQIAE